MSKETPHWGGKHELDLPPYNYDIESHWMRGKDRCPKCNAWPFDLWKAYGLIYYKCAKCGYEQRL